jgi:DNA-binding protein
MGVQIPNAIEVINWVTKKLERPEMGVVKIRYGKIKLGQQETEDKRTRPYMEIPCRIVMEELEGYRAIRDLDQNPWQGKLEEVDKSWRDKLVNTYFPSLTEDKEMNLVGYGMHIVDAVTVFDIMKSRMTALDVDYQDAELGSRLKERNIYKCGINIKVTAKGKA